MDQNYPPSCTSSGYILQLQLSSVLVYLWSCAYEKYGQTGGLGDSYIPKKTLFAGGINKIGKLIINLLQSFQWVKRKAFHKNKNRYWRVCKWQVVFVSKLQYRLVIVYIEYFYYYYYYDKTCLITTTLNSCILCIWIVIHDKLSRGKKMPIASIMPLWHNLKYICVRTVIHQVPYRLT